MKNETTATDKKQAQTTTTDKTSSAVKAASGKALEVQDTSGAEMPDASAASRGTTKEDAQAAFSSKAQDDKAAVKK